MRWQKKAEADDPYEEIDQLAEEMGFEPLDHISALEKLKKKAMGVADEMGVNPEEELKEM